MRYRATVAAIVLVVGAAACALAQSSRPSDKQEDAAAKRQQEGIDQLRALTSEVKAIREKQATAEERAAKQEAEQGRIFSPQNASQWVLAVFAAVAAIIAARSLRAINRQVSANITAGEAAKSSAETADAQFKMAMTGVLGIKDAFMKIINIGPQYHTDSGFPTSPPILGIAVGYKLFNASSVPISWTGIEVLYRVSGDAGPERTFTTTINETLTVG